MNSIERVKAAMRFTGPDLVPVWKAGLGDVFPMPMLPSKLWLPGHAEYEKGLFPYTSADEIIKLKHQSGKDIGVAGSPTLVRFLLMNDLLDELTLMIHPRLTSNVAAILAVTSAGLICGI